MPSNGQIVTSGLIDTSAITLTPVFAQPTTSSGQSGGEYSTPKAEAKLVHLRVGREPSYANCFIPLKSIDDSAPSIAGVNSSPLKGIKKGSDARIVAQYNGKPVTLLVGVVTNVNQNLKPDTGLVVISDHRYLLQGKRVVGRFDISGSANTGLSYRQGERAHMNKDGPNCTIGPFGACFCPVNMGLAAGEEPPAVLTVGKASYWTIPYALEYVHFAYAPGGGSAGYTTYFPWYTTVDGRITWPESYASAITNVQDGTSSVVKAREMDITGMRIDVAISYLIEMSGHYGLYFSPAASGYTSTLEIVPTRYDSTVSGITINRASGNDGLNSNVIISGGINEDITDLFTLMVVSGDMVYIERRMDSYSIGLEPAWSQTGPGSDQDNLMNYIMAPTSGIIPNSIDALRAGFAIWDKVFVAYRMKSDYDFQAGTSQSAFPRAQVFRPPLPHLLSSYLEGLTSNQKDTVNALWPVRFELSTDGMAWFLADEHDGFRIDEDGTFWIPGLRKLAQISFLGNTWVGNINPVPGTPTKPTLARAYIRATLVVPCDHRLTGSLKLACDQTANVNVLPAGDDSAEIDPNLSRMFAADAAALYAYSERYQSWAPPETIKTPGQAAKTGVLRDDTSYITQQLKKRLNDIGRINRSARLLAPHLQAGLNPGDMVADLNNTGDGSSFPIRACCHEVIFTCDGNGKNSTERILG